MGSIAIHGFGRIGRSTLKVALKRALLVPASISDIKDPATLAALFEVDTNYGHWNEEVRAIDKLSIVIGGREITYFDSSESIPDWGELGVDLVIDCTHMATRRAGAEAHFDRGAKRVLVSAPSQTLQDADAVLLPGINLGSFDPAQHRIVSVASCTTNALAPVVKTLIENLGIESAFFSTVHAYTNTNTQSLTDQPMRDRRDSWAAAENIIPAASGAARALQFIWPDLKITGKAYRVPVPTVSIAEVNAVVERKTTADEVKDSFGKAATTVPLEGIMGVLEEEWASSRVLGDEHSSVIDLPLVQVLDGTLVSVAAWYDNEVGYATRLAETAVRMAA